MSEEMTSLQGRHARSTTEEMVEARVRHTVQPSGEICERLRAAVAVAGKRDAESLKDLRSAVSAFTIALKGDGSTPEAVLISLKSLVTIAALPPTDRSHPDWAGYLLREKLSTWCIQDYFDRKES